MPTSSSGSRSHRVAPLRAPHLIFALLIATWLTPEAAAGQTQNQATGARRQVSVTAHIVEQGPTIDGRLDDAAWAGAPVLDGFVQRDPVEGNPVSQRTEARVVVDDDALRSSDAELEAATLAQMRRWFGDRRVDFWRPRAIVRIPHALPRQHPEDFSASRSFECSSRLFRCGDHLSDGSINGAMRGGRLAAEAVAASLGRGAARGVS